MTKKLVLITAASLGVLLLLGSVLLGVFYILDREQTANLLQKLPFISNRVSVKQQAQNREDFFQTQPDYSPQDYQVTRGQIVFFSPRTRIIKYTDIYTQQLVEYQVPSETVYLEISGDGTVKSHTIETINLQTNDIVTIKQSLEGITEIISKMDI